MTWEADLPLNYVPSVDPLIEDLDRALDDLWMAFGAVGITCEEAADNLQEFYSLMPEELKIFWQLVDESIRQDKPTYLK